MCWCCLSFLYVLLFAPDSGSVGLQAAVNAEVTLEISQQAWQHAGVPVQAGSSHVAAVLTPATGTSQKDAFVVLFQRSL